MRHHVFERNAAKVEPLGARDNGGEDPLRVGGRQHEYHAVGRFFQGFEQGIERRRTQHVALVDDVNLIAALNGGELRSLDQLANVIDPRIARRVNFDHIESIPPSDGATGIAATARRIRGILAVEAIERFCQNAGAGGFPRSPRTGK